MAAVLQFKWSGEGIARMTMAMSKLAGPRKVQAFRRALNHTGDVTYTRVRRTLAKQMGLSAQRAFSQYGALKKVRASNAGLEYQIIGTGRAIPLKEFSARQTARGVTAAPWAVRRLFASTFIVARFGGNVYKRLSRKRFPIKKLYGPSVPRELLRDETPVIFQEVVATRLPARVEHEVRVITDRVLS